MAESTNRLAESDLGGLSAPMLDLVFQRLHLIQPLLGYDALPEEIVVARAHEVEKSPRTLWRYIRAYRQYGLVGLARLPRADRGKSHRLSPALRQQVEAIRLTHRLASLRFVHQLAVAWAKEHQEPPPSRYQVRRICAAIPAPVLAIADGQQQEFHNRYRLTYPMAHPATPMIWQMDHREPVPVFVLHAGKTIRPYLTMVVDSGSRVVMAARLCVDKPDRYAVAAAIHDALLMTETHPYGGLPAEIWVDNGKELIARHIWQLLTGLGITLTPGPPHAPQIRGIVERLHRTLSTQLWSTLPGHCGANPVKRPERITPTLTLEELDHRLRTYLATDYHLAPLEELHGEAPLVFWQAQVHPIPVEERLLDILLLEPLSRRVLKSGIKYGNQLYWDAALGEVVGGEVTIRVPPSPPTPEAIEVYTDGHWIASAKLVAPGAVAVEEIARAQRQQMKQIRKRIQQGRGTSQDPAPPQPADPAPAPSAYQLLATQRKGVPS